MITIHLSMCNLLFIGLGVLVLGLVLFGGSGPTRKYCKVCKGPCRSDQESYDTFQRSKLVMTSYNCL